MLIRENFIGPWAGLPVAWTKNGLLDEATYRTDVASCCKAGVPGVYSGGTSAEFYAMEFDEFQTVAKITVEECKKYHVPCMIGCTSTLTRAISRGGPKCRAIGVFG